MIQRVLVLFAMLLPLVSFGDCYPPAPVAEWPYDETEEALIQSMAGMPPSARPYEDLGDLVFTLSPNTSTGTARWSATYPFAIYNVQVSTPDHPIPYSQGTDYEGYILDCFDQTSGVTNGVEVTFKSPGIYGVKITPLDTARKPIIFLAQVNAHLKGPAESCRATRSMWTKQLFVPGSRFGLQFATPGDSTDLLERADMQEFRRALNVDTAAVTDSRSEFEAALWDYRNSQIPNLPFSANFTAHGFPSQFRAYYDDAADARNFANVFKGSLWRIAYVSCCSGMGYPQPQWGGAQHLLTTMANGLSDFPEGVQNDAWGLDGVAYLAEANILRSQSYFVPKKVNWVIARGEPPSVKETIQIVNPQTAAVLTFSYSWKEQAPVGNGCVRMTVPAGALPHDVWWGDNELCGPASVGLEWSQSGGIPGKRCTQVNEPADEEFGSDKYICVNDVPTSPTITFTMPKPASIANCLQILDPSEPQEHNWIDNWMCFSFP